MTRDFHPKNSAASLAISFLFAQAGVCSAAPDSGKLEFDKVHVGQLARRELKIPNNSDKPVVIKEVNSSCACLRVVGVDRSIAPKTTGTLVVEYRPVQAGSAEVEILVETDRPNDPIATFRWEGNVLPPIASKISDGGLMPFASFVSPTDLADRLGANPNLLLIDVRTPENFNKFHIVGAVNWPLSMVGTLASQAKRQGVLVGEGYDDQVIVREVINLQKRGVADVRVLRGGIRSWALSKRAMIGASIGTAKGALVEPSILFASSQDEWVIFGVSAGSPISRLPGSINLPFVSGLEKAFGESFLHAMQSQPHASKALVVSSFGELYELIEKALPKDSPMPVFYLSGGLSAYSEFVNRRGAMQNRREIKLAGGGVGDALMPAGTIVRGGGAGCATCPRTGGTK